MRQYVDIVNFPFPLSEALMSSSAPPRPRLDTLLPAALLVAGSLAFLGAGARHPHIDAALGPVGSDAFFRAFADVIMRVPNWEMIHTVLLAGPVLWALGAAGVACLALWRWATRRAAAA